MTVKEWEEIYKCNQQISIWPWSDVVSYTMRYVKPKEDAKVLEIGFGAGANIPFFQTLGVDFYGIEGSKTIVEKVKQKYPMYSKNLVCGDFTKELPFDIDFDLIIDRGSMTLNSTYAIKNTLDFIYQKLKTGGYFVGIDWFSPEHSEYNKSATNIDENTKKFHEGYWANAGLVHFADEKHLKDLLSKFKLIKMEHKMYTDVTNNGTHDENDTLIQNYAAYNFIVKKVNNAK